MAITFETVAVNRYAPDGSEAINLYSTDAEGGSSLTLGQLAIAVSMRSAAAYEAQSVVKMNKMSVDSDTLEIAEQYMAGIANGTANWDAAKSFMVNTLGITTELPGEINTYDKRMAAIEALKSKVDALAQKQQTDMIDLQTLVNRRDVAYSTSSNMVRTLGTSMGRDAANFI